MCRKRDGQDKFNFKTYGVTTLLICNYKTGIAQYLTKSKQPESDIWLVNRNDCKNNKNHFCF